MTGPITIHQRGHLPHWEAEGAVYFVTFRLADSLPKHLLETWVAERDRILRHSQRLGRPLTDAQKKRLQELFRKRIEALLDAGAGACWLGRPEIAEVVRDALLHFDGRRYSLFAWCVMPNHVHLVFQLSPGEQLARLLHSWKSYTAKEINRLLGRRGRFWQREYFDRLVRDEKDFHRILRYVAENPLKTGLVDWPWVWVMGLHP